MLTLLRKTAFILALLLALHEAGAIEIRYEPLLTTRGYVIQAIKQVRRVIKVARVGKPLPAPGRTSALSATR